MRPGFDSPSERNAKSLCFLSGLDDEESASNAGDPGLMPGLVRSPGEGNGCQVASVVSDSM